MKNLHLIAFTLLTLVVLIVIYNQQKQERFMEAMTDALVKVSQDTDHYRTENKALLSAILQVADGAEANKPEERKPIGYKIPQKKEAYI